MRLTESQQIIASRHIKEEKELVFFSQRDGTVYPLSRLDSLDDQKLSELWSEIASQLTYYNALIEDIDVRIHAGQDVDDSMRIRKKRNCLSFFLGGIKRAQKKKRRS